MIRFLSVLISLFIVGYLIAHDTWMVTITGFEYEVTTSVLVLALAFILLLYIGHLLKKPFHWLERYRNWSERRRQNRKEAYLLTVLKTVLDKDSRASQQLLKQRNHFFDKKSDENYLIEALFAPTPHVFEQLIHREKTELAGIQGLLSYARKGGDYDAVGRLLRKASEKHADEPWLQEMLWEVNVMQNDWAEALATLDKMKKTALVDQTEYTTRKALVLMKLGRVKEAYKLLPDHPAVALAYAELEPHKARAIVTDLWATAPTTEAFALFKKAIADEKPTKQAKLIEHLIQRHPSHKISLLVQAQTAMEQGLFGVAKEHLTAYLNTYPLTQTVARLMAEAERKGWNHEAEAKSWDAKAAEATDDTGWGCAVCGHKTQEWDAVCPNCNTFGSVKYK